MYCWSLDLIFKAKLKLESGTQKIQYGCPVGILKVTSLEINRLLPIATSDMHMKFETEIPKQTSSYTLATMPSKGTRKRKMQYGRQAASFCWKSLGFYPYIQVSCYRSSEFIFKAKLSPDTTTTKIWPLGGHFESDRRTRRFQYTPSIFVGRGKTKIQYGRQAAILKMTLLRINWLLSI